MKYFLDTEFIEGFHGKASWFSKKRHHTIQLISIGIVDENGREFFALSSEYDFKQASPWVVNNVIVPMYKILQPYQKEFLHIDNFHKHVGMTHQEIRNGLLKYFYCHAPEGGNRWLAPGKDHTIGRTIGIRETHLGPPSVQQLYGEEIRMDMTPEIYGYYADYDWVLFCSLFGTMMDLPDGFPMYCRDLKQTLDERGTALKDHVDYPKQEDEHHALSDARWNKKLYEFLQNH